MSTPTGFAAISEKKNELIRKGLKGSVFIAPTTSAVITKTNLFDPTSGDLKVLPAGYIDVGRMTDDGAKWGRAVKDTDITSWGTTSPTRSDRSSDVTTLVIAAQETKLATMGLYLGAATSALTPGTNGAMEIQRAPSAVPLYYRVLGLAVDEIAGQEFVVARFLPRAKVTDFADQSYANGDDALEWGVTLTAYTTSTVGFAVDDLMGGAAVKGMLGDMGFPRTVKCTVATSTALVATTGTFLPTDVGAVLSGTGITTGTTITTYTDATHVVMSAAGTTAGSNVPVTVSY
jgi:hypothetical protein